MTTVDKSTKLYSRFDPRAIPDCTLWLDANDSSTITKSGSNISTWRDKSSGGFNATNGSSTGPTTVTTGNRTYISFNGTSNFLQTSLTLTANKHTILIVYKPNANTASSNSLLRAQATVGYIVFPYYTSTKNAYITNFDGSGVGSLDATYSNLDPTASTTSHNVVSISIASGAQAIYNNGTSKATNTATITTTVSDPFTIGAFYGTPPQQYYTGELAEVVIYNRTLSSTERIQLEGYLAWKWGLQANLAVGHTYISRNPTLSLFQPTDISNTCALWFDAADTSKITGTTQITSWVNKGTLTTTATNFTGSCTSGNTINGLNYVRCPAGTEMRFTTALNTQARTWFYVGRLITALTSGTFAGPINQSVGSGQDSIVFGYVDASNNGVYIGPSTVAVTVGANLPSSTLGNLCLVSIVNSTSTSLNAVTLNGTSYSLTYSLAASSYNTTSIAYKIGTAVYNTTVDIMEVLFYYGDLSASDRQTVEGHLAWKWKIQSTLPSTHPFKNFPPAKIN